MRTRWGLLVIVAVYSVGAVIIAMSQYTLAMDREVIRGLCSLLGISALVLGVIGLVVRSAVRGAVPQDAPTRSAPPRQEGFPMAQLAADTFDGPGLYEVSGVDRATKMDTTWRVQAETRANAKAKGELEGIVVTSVRFVGS